jgi:hypothetical protein
MVLFETQRPDTWNRVGCISFATGVYQNSDALPPLFGSDLISASEIPPIFELLAPDTANLADLAPPLPYRCSLVFRVSL